MIDYSWIIRGALVFIMIYAALILIVEVLP